MVTASVDTVVCTNAVPFAWNGINITGAGSYDYTTTASSGCDSTTTLNVTLSSVVTASVDTVVCQNSIPFVWNGINITGAGSYDYTTTASSGCDSTTTLNVTLSSVVTASVDTVVCTNQYHLYGTVSISREQEAMTIQRQHHQDVIRQRH